MELNNSQKLAAIKLFSEGVTHYRDISQKLGVPYASVNRVLTTWRRENGLLGKRKVSDDCLEKELTFLREFYLRSIMNKDELKH